MANYQNYDFFNRNQASPFLQSPHPQPTNQNSPIGSLNLPYHPQNSQMQFFGDNFQPNTCSSPRFPGPSNHQGSGRSGCNIQLTIFKDQIFPYSMGPRHRAYQRSVPQNQPFSNNNQLCKTLFTIDQIQGGFRIRY